MIPTSRLLVLVAAAMLPLHASGSEGRKLSTAELDALINSDYLAAGITDHGWAFASVNRAGGQREVYRNNFIPFTEGKTRQDTATVKDGQVCVLRHDQQFERCFDVFHLKGNVYESWLNGVRYATWTLFRRPH